MNEVSIINIEKLVISAILFDSSLFEETILKSKDFSWEDTNRTAERLVNEIFRNLNIPVRTLECCTGDLADLKYESLDIEAWSPRQKKYFEVASCSNLTDAQSRRLGIRIKDGKEKYYAHTLNNTVIASPRMLISFLENNLNKDGSIYIPKVLRPYMGGIEKIAVK